MSLHRHPLGQRNKQTQHLSLQYRLTSNQFGVFHIISGSGYIHDCRNLSYTKRLSHGSRFPCQKVYIHGCRASSLKALFTRQPFCIPEGLYTRLSCIKYKSAIYVGCSINTRKDFIECLPLQQGL